MYISTAFFVILLGALFAAMPDPCEEAATGAAAVTLLAKDSVYCTALKNIRDAFNNDQKEHTVTFGKNQQQQIIASAISTGTGTAGPLNPVADAFADLHNHPNNTAPDAGDLYGLIDINLKNAAYRTRYIVTSSGVVYALLVMNPAAATAFNRDYPRQQPVKKGLQPAFPAGIVDEFRQMKYEYNCTDAMSLAFILDHYKVGVLLLRQDDKGNFKRLYTEVKGQGIDRLFIEKECP